MKFLLLIAVLSCGSSTVYAEESEIKIESLPGVHALAGKKTIEVKIVFADKNDCSIGKGKIDPKLCAEMHKLGDSLNPGLDSTESPSNDFRILFQHKVIETSLKAPQECDALPSGKMICHEASLTPAQKLLLLALNARDPIQNSK